MWVIEEEGGFISALQLVRADSSKEIICVRRAPTERIPPRWSLRRRRFMRKFHGVATKTERFKAEMERTAQGINKAEGAKGATRRSGRKRPHGIVKVTHNAAPAHAKKSSYALETTVSSRPSRKSTRKSSNRQKTDSGLRISVMSMSAKPESRARRRSGNAS